MKFLQHILASLVSLALSTVILLSVMSLTIGTATFWLDAARKSNLYQSLAQAVPGTTAPAIQAMIEPVVPPLIDHFANGGPAPVLNVAAVTPAGQPAPDPITITGAHDAAVITAVSALRRAWWWAVGSAVGLIAVIIVVMKDRRWATLTRAGMWCMVSTLVSGLLCMLVPNLAGFLLGSPELAAVRPALQEYCRVIGLGIGTYLLMAAGGLLAAVVVLALTGQTLKLRAKFTPKYDKMAQHKSPES